MSLIRAMRDGKENDPRFGSRMHAEGSYAELIGQRFEVCSRRLGLHQGRGFQLSTQLFPSRTGPVRGAARPDLNNNKTSAPEPGKLMQVS